MAQAFNWDEHPIAKAEPTKSKEFNWDEHPIESKQEPSDFDNLGKSLAEGKPLDSLKNAAVIGGKGLIS